ncbi:MAG: hypothetical protein ACM3QZ_10050 [Solirubrobacterales bacterium]
MKRYRLLAALGGLIMLTLLAALVFLLRSAQPAQEWTGAACFQSGHPAGSRLFLVQRSGRQFTLVVRDYSKTRTGKTLKRLALPAAPVAMISGLYGSPEAGPKAAMAVVLPDRITVFDPAGRQLKQIPGPGTGRVFMDAAAIETSPVVGYFPPFTLAVLTAESGARYGRDIRLINVFAPPDSPEWRQDLAEFKPHHIFSGFFDAELRSQLGVVVYKKTRYHPVMADRPFLYSVGRSRLAPKWLGSRLSRPFRSLYPARLTAAGTGELLALETDRTGRFLLQAYCWDDFGFEGIAATPASPSLPTVFVLDWDGDGRDEVVTIRESAGSLRALRRLSGSGQYIETVYRLEPEHERFREMDSRTLAGRPSEMLAQDLDQDARTDRIQIAGPELQIKWGE